jgi:hypothetical protein
LHLGHRQVQEFIEAYIRQFLIWETWQENVEQIPHAALLEYALSKRKTVAELLQQYRPRLYTEQITREDEERGFSFLFSLDIQEVLEEFEAFTNEHLTGFLRLNIEWDFIQEAIDKQQILASVGLGWVNPGEVIKVMMRSLPHPVSEQSFGVSNTLVNKVSSGPVQNDRQTSNVPEDETMTDAPDQPLDTGKQRAEPVPHTEGTAMEGSPCQEAPMLSLIPEPHGLRATPAQQQMLRLAIQRTAPESYSIVQGSYATKLVSTLVEQERGPRPAQSAYRPRGLPLYARQVVGIVGSDDQDDDGALEGTGRDGSADQQLVRHDYRNATRNSSQTVPRELLNPSSGRSGHNTAAQTSRHEGDRYHPSQAEGFDSIHDVEQTVFARLPQSLAARQQHEQGAPPTPSKQLRQMLEEKYHDFLAEVNEEEKKATTEDDSDDEAAMDLDDIILPEPENDEEYCPKKKSARKPPKKKATSTRKSGGQAGRPRKAAPKKNEQDVTPKNNAGPRDRKGQAGSEAAESSTRSTPIRVNIQETPTKKHTGGSPTSSGPPSSGRIRLIVRPTQKSSTEPNNPGPSTTIPSEDPPTPTRTPTSRVKHAISAKYATYASMSTHARFARTAVRSAKKIDETTPQVPVEMIDPNKLALGFSKIRRGGKQNADRAEFAWKAEKADYAGTAFEADDALEVLMKGGQGDSKGID